MGAHGYADTEHIVAVVGFSAAVMLIDRIHKGIAVGREKGRYIVILLVAFDILIGSVYYRLYCFFRPIPAVACMLSTISILRSG